MSLKSKDFLPTKLLDQQEDFKDNFLSDDIHKVPKKVDTKMLLKNRMLKTANRGV